jgi:hypothetical protein
VIDISELGSEVVAVATAIGLLKSSGPGSVQLKTDFFSSPADHLAKMVSDQSQRTALLDAIDGLLPQGTPGSLNGSGRAYHPLLHTDPTARGQLYLSVERASNTAGARVDLGLAAEVQASGGGPAVTAELPLLYAQGTSVTPTAGTDAGPLTLELRVPMPSTGGHIGVALRLSALPQAHGSFVVRLEAVGADGKALPALELDPLAAPAGVGQLAAALLESLFATLDPNPPAEIELLAKALPGLLGLADGLPPFPFGSLSDQGAVRGWLASLAAATDTSGRSALAAWLDDLGQLLGAPASGAGGLPTEDDPFTVPLVAAAAGVPAIDLLVGVRTDPAGGGQALVATLRVSASSASPDAALEGEAVLLVLPLAGTSAPTLLERLDLVVRAPGGSGKLIPSGPVTVDGLRAGLRYDGTSVQPLLELTTVDLGAAGSFPSLDLTDVHTLGSAAQSGLETAIRNGLGSGSDLVDAVFVLLGIDQATSVDLTKLASTPTRALADYYRRLRSQTGGWQAVLEAIWRLLGGPSGQSPQVDGSGTREDPWRVELAHFAAPSGARPKLQIALWDDSPAGDAEPKLRLGLRAEVDGGPPTWSLAAMSELAGFDLPDGGGGAVSWLGEQALRVSVTSPGAAQAAGIEVTATALEGSLSWRPGGTLAAETHAEDLTVSDGTTSVTLGTLPLPPSAPDLTDAALGLGVAADDLWAAARMLVGRAAASWGGGPGAVLAALLGVGSPSAVGLPDELPPLPLPQAGDLRSLLSGPAAALRGWLATLVDAEEGVAADGAPLLSALRRPLQAFLTASLPALVGLVPNPDVPPAGQGSWDDPWTVPLQPADSAMPVELLAWLEPNGPPASWADAAVAALYAERPDARDVIDAVLALAPYLGERAKAVDPDDPAAAVDALRSLADALAASDGIVPADAALPADDGWDLASVAAAAPHHLLPGAVDVVSEVLERVTSLTSALQAEDWFGVLLAPDFAGDDCWDALLAAAGIADAQTIDMRQAGIPPANVDLGAVSSASWYVVHLADDGTPALADVVTQLGRVTDRIAAVKTGAKALLVAHSHAAVPATSWAAANSAHCLGLVTVGAPLSAVDVPALSGDAGAEGVRLVRTLAPGGLPSAPAIDATLTFLETALDGYRAGGDLPSQAAFPTAAFARAPDTLPDLKGVPALAIAGAVETDLVLAVADVLSGDVGADDDADRVSHLAYGVRAGLGLPPAADGDPDADVSLRLDLGRTPLVVGAADPPQPLSQLVVHARLGGPGQWLLGGAGDGSVQQARVRSAELLFVLAADGAGGRVQAVDARLRDVSADGVPASWVDLRDPAAPALLAALVRSLDGAAASGGRVAAVLDVLAGLGLVRRGGPGGTAVAADSLAALLADPTGYLAPLVPGLLDAQAGLLGLKRDAGARDGAGPWRLAHDSLPVEVLVEASPWRVTVHTTGDGLVTSGDGRLKASGSLRLSDLAPATETHLSFAGMELHRDPQSGQVTLTSPWLDDPLTLAPADPTQLLGTLGPLLPRLLVDAALTALVEELAGGEVRLRSLGELVRRPGAWLAEGLGDGTLPQADQVNALLASAAAAAGLDTGTGKPLALPGGLVVSASDQSGAVRLEVSTPAPLDFGGLQLSLDAHVDLDAARHPTPGGAVSLKVPLPQAAGWTSVGIDLGADPAGLALSIDVATPGGDVNVGLLPQVSGLADLVTAGAELLLAEALDEVANALGPAGPSKPGVKAALDVAAALGVYDPAQAPKGFRNSASMAKLATLVADLEQGNLGAASVASAIDSLLKLLLGSGAVPSSLSATEAGVSLGGVLGGTLSLTADLAHVPPAVSLSADGLGLGVATAHVSAGYAKPDVTASVRLDTSLDTGRGVTLTPRVDAGLTSGQLSVKLRPLGDDSVVVALAPTPGAPTAADLEALAEHWIVPLAANLALGALEPWLSQPVWQGATKTGRAVLVDSGLVDSLLHVKAIPLPAPAQLLVDTLKGLAGLQIPLPGGVALSVAADTAANHYGLAVSGEVDIPAGDYEVAVRLGAPASVGAPWGNDGKAVALFLLDASKSPPQAMALLRLGGFGVGVSGANEKPLVDSSGFRLDKAAAYVLADLPLLGTQALKRPTTLNGAIELDGLGLPLGAGGDGANPVASSLLQSGGSGDTAPANPPLDLTVAGGSRGWTVGFGGQPDARLDVHKSFGPLHIDDVLLGYRNQDGSKPTGPTTQPGRVAVGLDGGVAIGPMAVDVEGLTLSVPLRHPAEVSQWSVDLAGLAANFSTSAISVAGGLLKNTAADGTIEYDGALSVQVAGRGLTAIGSYARPQNQYTSLFVFVSLSVPLGGPPYLFVLGLAGGAGYNRRLLVPSDPTAVPSFPLVAAMDGFDGMSPMDALGEISKDIPPARGSYWVAAGVKFTTFELLNTRALAYASLDRGLELGLLGLMNMALPAPEVAVVSVELALAARYSTVDQVLSIRAALTRNSWLISSDCQLTGGFAFVTWFAKPEAVLTIGGYGPLYQPPSYYPQVDQIGFHWAVGGGIVVKGGAYFALTPDALMFGGRLEASYDVDPIRIWFVAYLDALVQWDPFHYQADAGVQIGATFHVEICFFACVTISVSVSMGAQVELDGPPLHAIVTVDLDIASVTVEFGSSQPQDALTWGQFSGKYLTTSDPVGGATKTTVAAGARAVQVPPQADRTADPDLPQGPPNGTANRPWAVGPEFTLRVETKLPAIDYVVNGRSAATPQLTLDRSSFDVVPMQSSGAPIAPTLDIAITAYRAPGVPSMDILALTPSTAGFPAAIWEGGAHDGSQPTMVHGLGAVQLAVTTTPQEASGRLGDVTAVPVSTLVDELSPKGPLPLTGAAGSTVVPLPAPKPAPAPGPGPTRDPLLRAVVPPPRAARSPAGVARTTATGNGRLTPRAPRRATGRGGARLVRVPAQAPPRAARERPLRDPALAPAAVEPGAAHVFDLPRGPSPLSVGLSGGGDVRVTALSATGVPLLDAAGPASDFRGARARLPEAAARLVVTGGGGPGDAGPWGWQLSTPLLRVAPTTLLGHGATVLTSREVVPPRGARRNGPETWLQASSVALTVPATTTILPAAAEVVVVQADRVADGAGLGDLVVTSTGGSLGEATLVEDGRRACLVFPVSAVGGDELRVSVASAADWKVAGVVGARGAASAWTTRMRSDSHPRVIEPTAPGSGNGAPARVSIKPVRPARKKVPA